MIGKTKIKVASLFNHVGDTNIGLENFLYIDSSVLEKHVIVFKQRQEPATDYIKQSGQGELKVFSCLQHGGGFPGIAGKILQLVKYTKREAIDVVHVHHAMPACIMFLASFFVDAKIITTIHSNFRNYPLHHKVCFLLSCLVSDRVVCNSENTLKSLPGLVSKKKRQLIYNGVPLEKIKKCMVEADKSDVITIGTVGRLVKAKDIGTLLLAYHEIKKDHTLPSSRLLLVGDGNERAGLEKTAEQLGIADSVFFLGELSREKAYQELSGMDIFVVASRWEGFCNALVEAAAMGKPIVVSNIDPLPEVIGSDNALFFPPGDYHALKNKLAKLLLERDMANDMGRRASVFVESRYSLKSSSSRYLAAYKAVL